MKAAALIKRKPEKRLLLFYNDFFLDRSYLIKSGFYTTIDDNRLICWTAKKLLLKAETAPKESYDDCLVLYGWFNPS